MRRARRVLSPVLSLPSGTRPLGAGAKLPRRAIFGDLMSDKKKVVILGGGTASHIRNHLALCMPAYGTTARALDHLCSHRFWPQMLIDLQLTKMAWSESSLETNEDVAAFVDELIADFSVKVIFFNVAMCDFAGYILGEDIDSGKYAPRLHSSSIKNYDIGLVPKEKILKHIRKTRKDIFLVAFKTTCGATEDEQYLAGLNLLKGNSCNLVLANDTKTRVNMIITPEEARYHVTKNRDEALTQLVDMTYLRSHLTFTRSTVVAGDPIPWDSDLVPHNLRQVVDFCIQKNAYKAFRGATVGHFACKIGENEFLTSIRKSNFNDIEKLGLVRITTDGPDSVLAYGARPSVGGQSQRIVFKEHPGTDCIVHFHCPIKLGSKVPRVSQREYECGSHECGRNTSRGLKTFTVGDNTGTYVISAVFLKEHGPNIVFSRSTPARFIMKFIEDNFDLAGKTGGYVSQQEKQHEPA